MVKYPLFVSGYKKVCYANFRNKLLRQGFVSRYACVKLKFKTAIATSLHLKITATFLSIEIQGLRSHQKIKKD